MGYFKYHYLLLRLIGLGMFHNPLENNYENFNNPLYVLYVIIQLGFWVFFYTFALWIELPNIYQDLDRLMLNLSFSITFTFSFGKLFIVIYKNKSIQRLVHEIEISMCEFQQCRRILNKTILISQRLTLSVLAFANLTVIGLIVGGVLQAIWSPKIRNLKQDEFKPSDRILPIPVYTPIGITSEYNYVIAFLYQIVGIQYYGNLVVIINTFMNTIMVHFAGRFWNLRYHLENVQKIALIQLKSKIGDDKFDINDVDTYGDDDYAEMHEEIVGRYGEDALNRQMLIHLRECIIHHISIISCVEKFEEIYNIGFLIHVINNLNIICHVMIQISENDILSVRCGTAIALFFTVVSEMLVQCYAGNELTLQGLGVAESAYNCNWYSTDKAFKRSLLILMIRAQKPLYVTAGKFVAISNATFVSIMKGAYSLFAVIRSTR